MGYRTQADLLQEVLENLGVLAAGQTPEIEDLGRVKEKLPGYRSTRGYRGRLRPGRRKHTG